MKTKAVSSTLTLDELLQEMHSLEEDLASYERKYGVLSETFYESYLSGEEPGNDAWLLDWTRWAGTYSIWLRRREQYANAIKAFRSRGASLSEIIRQGIRYESLSVSA
ncbi:MAG: hypothetical protein WCA08_18420 [Desulfoferrobacter sp.]